MNRRTLKINFFVAVIGLASIISAQGPIPAGEQGKTGVKDSTFQKRDTTWHKGHTGNTGPTGWTPKGPTGPSGNPGPDKNN